MARKINDIKNIFQADLFGRRALIRIKRITRIQLENEMSSTVVLDFFFNSSQFSPPLGFISDTIFYNDQSLANWLTIRHREDNDFNTNLSLNFHI